MRPIPTDFADLSHENRLLRAALDRARQRAEAERRRADALEATARKAWQFASWPAPARRDSDG